MKQRVNISDHAVLRYLERILEVDVEAIRDRLAAEIRSAAQTGARRVTLSGATFVFDWAPSGGITVVTVITNKMRSRPLKQIARDREV